jgi:small subunit ribosomal protein S4
MSDYGLQLQMKQMIRLFYGLSEKQFRRYYTMGDQKKGSTGVNLMQLLERRLDNVVYRLGLASTRAEARQLVTHKAILVNGKRVNIPSYLLSLSDIVEVAEKSKGQLRIAAALELLKQREPCEWLDMDIDKKRGVFKLLPELSELPAEFKVNLVVELYSK